MFEQTCHRERFKRKFGRKLNNGTTSILTLNEKHFQIELLFIEIKPQASRSLQKHTNETRHFYYSNNPPATVVCKEFTKQCIKCAK